MNTLRNIIGKTTQQALFGLLVVGTTCFLAVRGDISGETFFGLGLAVIAFLFRPAE